MKRGGRFADPNVVFSKPPTLNREQVRARNIENLREELFCAVCRRQIESDDPVRLRNHLIMDCVTVPADSANRESKFEMSRRLAALSAIYKINNGVRILERIAPVEEPHSTGSMNHAPGPHIPMAWNEASEFLTRLSSQIKSHESFEMGYVESDFESRVF